MRDEDEAYLHFISSEREAVAAFEGHQEAVLTWAGSVASGRER